MAYETRPFAVVTGASTGIGLELARQCRDNGFDLLIAADEPEIERAAVGLRSGDGGVVRCRRTYRDRKVWTSFVRQSAAAG